MSSGLPLKVLLSCPFSAHVCHQKSDPTTSKVSDPFEIQFYEHKSILKICLHFGIRKEVYDKEGCQSFYHFRSYLLQLTRLSMKKKLLSSLSARCGKTFDVHGCGKRNLRRVFQQSCSYLVKEKHFFWMSLHSPTEKTKTAGGMTKIPTSQSATAKLITNRFVTVLNLRVVMTDRITKVFPIIVVMMSKENSTISTIFAHGQLSASEFFCSVTFIFNLEMRNAHRRSLLQ